MHAALAEGTVPSEDTMNDANWDMAAAFVTQGAIPATMFNAAERRVDRRRSTRRLANAKAV
jgi:hypothetical protein